MSQSKKLRTLHAAAGEHLVLGELLRRNIEAYLAQGPTQSGWDILIRQNGAFKKVEVKTIDWPGGNGAVNISPSTVRGDPVPESDQTEYFDIMVVVLLDKEQPRSRFLILTPKEVRRRWKKPKVDRPKWTMTIPKELGQFAPYEDAWEKL